MKKQLFFLFILFILSLNLYAIEGIAIEGTLVLNDNTSIPIEGFTYSNDLDNYYIKCNYNNTEIKIGLSKISRIDVLSGNINKNGNKTRIELRDGKVYEVNDAKSSFFKDNGLYLNYITFDVINQKIITNSAYYEKIKSLILDKIGDVSVDPSTGQKFPPDYRYNPYTGKKLEPGTFGNP